jgi:hypothetical protein
MAARLLGALAAATVWLSFSAAAWACPACATRSGGSGGTLALAAGMIAVPYAVVAVALKVIRRLAAEPDRDPPR